MMLKLVLPGSCSCEGDPMVSKSRPRTFMDELDGFMAIGVILCERYQAKIWWPNLDGFEDAPATAIRGELMNVRAAVCMVGSVVGMARGGSWSCDLQWFIKVLDSTWSRRTRMRRD